MTTLLASLRFVKIVPFGGTRKRRLVHDSGDGREALLADAEASRPHFLQMSTLTEPDGS